MSMAAYLTIGNAVAISKDARNDDMSATIYRTSDGKIGLKIDWGAEAKIVVRLDSWVSATNSQLPELYGTNNGSFAY